MNRLKIFISLVWREVRQFFKNNVAVAVFLVAPVAYGILVGNVYKEGKVTGLPVMVVDLDSSPLSGQLIDAINESEYLQVVQVLRSPQGLKARMAEGEMLAVVHIPARFEADVQQRRHPEIAVDVDAVNMLAANYASTGIMRVLGTYNAGFEINSLQKSGLPAPAAEERFESFQISMSRFFNPSSNYLQFFYPGMLGTIMQQVFMLALALSFAREFDKGTFSELTAVSRNAGVLVFAKSIPYWVFGMGLWFMVLKLFFPVFNLPALHMGPHFWLLTGLFMAAITFLGIAVSIVLRTQLKATEVLMILATPGFILSGYTWPLEQMPVWVQRLASAIPLTHYLQGFRKLEMYGADPATLMPQYRGLAIITAVSLVVAVAALQFKINRKEVAVTAIT